jgi:hypothetical protein
VFERFARLKQLVEKRKRWQKDDQWSSFHRDGGALVGQARCSKNGGTKMDWTTTLYEEEKYAEIVTGGIADKNGSLAMAKEIQRILSEAKIKNLLIDHSNIRAVSGGIIDVYQRPMKLSEIGVIPGVRIAAVVNPDHKAFFRFLETVCVNRGLLFSIFEDKKSALSWLLASK